MKIIPDDTRSIAIKRFNLPVTVVDDCPTCKVECRTRFDGDDYISYPAIGRPTPVWLQCTACETHWDRNIVILFSVHVAPESA